MTLSQIQSLKVWDACEGRECGGGPYGMVRDWLQREPWRLVCGKIQRYLLPLEGVYATLWARNENEKVDFLARKGEQNRTTLMSIC